MLRLVLEPIISRKKSVVALPFLLIYHAIDFYKLKVIDKIINKVYKIINNVYYYL